MVNCQTPSVNPSNRRASKLFYKNEVGLIFKSGPILDLFLIYIWPYLIAIQI